MIQYFKDLFCKIKYNKSPLWSQICQITDSDMVILVHRLVGTNHLEIEIFDKISGNPEDYKLRKCYTSAGNPKYATMLGYGGTCEDCEEGSDLQLDDIIKESEQNI